MMLMTSAFISFDIEFKIGDNYVLLKFGVDILNNISLFFGLQIGEIPGNSLDLGFIMFIV